MEEEERYKWVIKYSDGTYYGKRVDHTTLYNSRHFDREQDARAKITLWEGWRVGHVRGCEIKRIIVSVRLDQ